MRVSHYELSKTVRRETSRCGTTRRARPFADARTKTGEPSFDVALECRVDSTHGENNMMRGFGSRPIALVAISILGVLSQASTAFGQMTTGTVNEASTDGSELVGIVVTARRTTERLQDTPMSIAVITADTIEKTSATNLEDLGRLTPGLTIVSAAPGQNQIILRGLSGNNTVGFYLDETPLSIGIGNAVQLTNFDMDPALFDLDRVEVLRGPQGSLYGASSFGGTVRYITNQPNLGEEHITT